MKLNLKVGDHVIVDDDWMATVKEIIIDDGIAYAIVEDQDNETLTVNIKYITKEN